jgi:hypothetical protein
MSLEMVRPAKTEVAFQQKLRDFVKREIERRQLTVDDVAKELNLLPSGARALLERQVWPIETGLRVAQQLSCDVDITIKTKK